MSSQEAQATTAPDGYADEVDLLKWPVPLPETWLADEVAPQPGWTTAYRITEDGEPRGTVQVVLAADSDVRGAYPAGLHDRLLEPSEDATAASLQIASEQVMYADSRCRRLVVAVPEEDVPQIARAESAGYRYVVDVDLVARSVSLMVAEPDWVLEESRNIDDVPGT